VKTHAPHSFAQRPFVTPDGATKILLVRHGAMAIDGPLIDHGHLGRPLSDLGRLQAEAIADRLDDEPMRIFVSPTHRTQQTAAPLAQRLSVEPIVIEETREVGLGDTTGAVGRRLVDPDDPLTQAVFNEERWELLPDAETAADFGARIRLAIERIVALTGPGTAVSFTHGGFIGEVCAQATGSSPFTFVGNDNGSITRLLVLPDGGWLLRGFNEISHLPVAGRVTA
jgi:probable phosphoglycerate mutase